MELKVKILKWQAGFPVVMLNKETADKIGVHTKERVSVKTKLKKPQEIFAILDLVDHLARKNEIAVSSDVKRILFLKSGQKVDVNIAPSPKSMILIKKKLNSQKLNQNEIDQIIKDVTDNSLSEAEIALFISAMYKQGMNMQETIYLIKSLLNSGNQLKFKGKLVADKHSIGGIPGRTTPIVVSICASAELIIPKTSSRAITTPAGTADAMETIAKVDFNSNELRKIIKKTNACIVWGGGLEMVPADSKIIQIEKQLNIDPESQMLASVMSKKLAVGSKYILIHIPYGKTAKVNRQKALHLKKKFEYLGKYFKKNLKVILTENKGPIGNGIGPALEIIDVVKILKREDCCNALERESLQLSGAILEMTGKAKKGQGEKLALEILNSGKAFKKFKQIVKAQEGSLNKLKFKAKFKKDIFSVKSGRISEIDNKRINDLARILGCPADKYAGIYLFFHAGENFGRGDKLLTFYSESKDRLKKAISFYKYKKPLIIT